MSVSVPLSTAPKTATDNKKVATAPTSENKFIKNLPLINTLVLVTLFVVILVKLR